MQHTILNLNRPSWTPIYMGEGHPYRCRHCGQVKQRHEQRDSYFVCYDTFLRAAHGDR